MAIQQQTSRNFGKVCFRACLPDTTVTLRKQVFESPEDIN